MFVTIPMRMLIETRFGRTFGCEKDETPRTSRE